MSNYSALTNDFVFTHNGSTGRAGGTNRKGGGNKPPPDDPNKGRKGNGMMQFNNVKFVNTNARKSQGPLATGTSYSRKGNNGPMARRGTRNRGGSRKLVVPGRKGAITSGPNRLRAIRGNLSRAIIARGTFNKAAAPRKGPAPAPATKGKKGRGPAYWRELGF